MFHYIICFVMFVTHKLSFHDCTSHIIMVLTVCIRMIMIASVIMTQINRGVQHAQPNIIKKNIMVNTYLYRCTEFKVVSTVGQHFISVGMGMELSLSNKPAGFKMN